MNVTPEIVSYLVENAKTPRDVENLARAYAEVAIQIEALENLKLQMDATLRKSLKEPALFAEIDRKVFIQDGAEITEIDTAVVNELTFDEIKSIVKVTQTSLTQIDRPDLIAKYKRVTGTKAASLLVKPLSKEDKKKLQG